MKGWQAYCIWASARVGVPGFHHPALKGDGYLDYGDDFLNDPRQRLRHSWGFIVGQMLRCQWGCETCKKLRFWASSSCTAFPFGKSRPTRIFAGLFITIGKKKMDKGEQFCLFSFPFNSLVLEKRSGRGLGPCAGRPLRCGLKEFSDI